MTEATPKCVIVAPHIDDEAIGCYTELASGRVRGVVYCFDHEDPRRREEAARAGEHFGFDPVLASLPDLLDTFNEFSNVDEILLPSRFDKHAHHALVTNGVLAKLSSLPSLPRVRFYSVDMNVPKCMPLPHKDAMAKKASLYKIYSSQATYLDQHPQAWLFEDIRDTDSWSIRRIDGLNCSTDFPLAVRVRAGSHLCTVSCLGLTITTASVSSVLTPTVLPWWLQPDEDKNHTVPHLNLPSISWVMQSLTQHILSMVMALNPGTEVRVSWADNRVSACSANFPQGAVS